MSLKSDYDWFNTEQLERYRNVYERQINCILTEPEDDIRQWQLYHHRQHLNAINAVLMERGIEMEQGK